MAGVLDVQTTLADPRQTPTDDFRASELDAGFHFLYELKFEEARNQFEAWQKSHPEGPLGSASERRAICYSTTINIRGESYRLKERRKAGLVPAREQERAASSSLASDSVAPKARQKTALGSTASEAKEAAL